MQKSVTPTTIQIVKRQIPHTKTAQHTPDYNELSISPTDARARGAFPPKTARNKQTRYRRQTVEMFDGVQQIVRDTDFQTGKHDRKYRDR